MKSRLLAGVVFATGFMCAIPALAAEQYLEFVKALRDQGYYDYAVLYLDQISARPNTPAEIKQVIAYEKAMTLLAGSKTERSPEKRLAQLDQALAFLEQFVRENPNHPAAADANSDRAQILLDKGRAEVLQSKSPSNQGTKRAFQERARGYISKARDVFQTAFDQHDANYKTFPAFIDKEKDKEKFLARSRSETNLITASLSLGMCTYEEAQTYDPASNDFKTLLNKAADEFEKMHQKYRSQVGGLYARAWQGKCYEEQKDYQKALGLYNELLGNPGEDESLSALKTQTLYFKLICLNSKDRHDYQVVVDLADEWVKKHQNESRTVLGLGIQWQQALAYESLGENRDIVKAEQERYWRQARTIATQISKFSGEYRDAATAMVQRLTVKLGSKEKEPQDFATAAGLANNAMRSSQDIKKEIDDGLKVKRPKEEIDKLQLDYANELNEAARYFERAFTLLKKDEDKKEVLAARLFYAYVNFWQRKNYEAAVLAEHVAKSAGKDDTLALDGAYLAMAALVQAFTDNRAPLDQKGDDMQLIIKACNRIANRWPGSERANEAVMLLGEMYARQKKPAIAADWYGKVPPADPKYPAAQIKAGQAFWTAYLSSARLVGAEKPSPEQSAAWLKSAQDHLRNGIDKISPTVPKEATPPAELIAAKMSLSQIIISQGRDADAMKLLLDDPHSVIKAVQVPDESQRPNEGITSRKFAIECYKLLLRCYIGTQNLDKARETMNELEKITAGGGDGGGADVTQLYVDLGKQLKEELERLRANQETERVDNLMKAFETFLNDMASRKDGQTFNSLSWIGETYFALGETLSNDPGKASAFYGKAKNAFAEILNRAKDAGAPSNPSQEGAFANPNQLYQAMLRQIRVLRQLKEFEAGEALAIEVLKENAKNLAAQTAAAELYQDWGLSGQADSAQKLIVAVSGNGKLGAWGWYAISKKLAASSEFGNNPDYMKNFVEARYNDVKCRQSHANGLGTKEKQTRLNDCMKELISTATMARDMTDDQYQKLNQLYRDVLQDAGSKIEDLPRNKAEELPPPVAEKKEEPEEVKTKDAAKKNAAPKAAEPASEGSDLVTYLVFGLLLLVGGAGIGYAVMKGKAPPKVNKSFSSVPASDPTSFTELPGGEALQPMPFAAPKPKPRPASASAPPATKPATKPAPKPGAAGTAAPKPKPKPPAPPAG